MSYPQLAGYADEAIQRQINEDIVVSAGVAGHLLVLGQLPENGFGLTVHYESFLTERLLSVVIIATGQGANGRYMQRNTALTYLLENGERVTAEQIFADVPATAAALELMLENTLGEELSDYLENRELSPLPVDNLFLNADGVTFYYPYEQLSLLSGYACAAQFYWEELRPYVRTESDAVPALAGYADKLDVARLREVLSQGRLPHVPVAIGDSLADAMERYRLLRDPDYYPGGQFFLLEDAAFRQVALLATGENEAVSGLRTRRFAQCGIQTGVTTRAEWRAVLGEPSSTFPFDESTAYNYSVPVGNCDFYQMGAYTLQLFSDADDVLYAVQLTR